MSLFQSFTSRIFGAEIRRQVFAALKEDDSTFGIGRSLNNSDRDRPGYDLQQILKDALDAWRVNPLARRIVSLTSQYVVGNGLAVTSKHKGTEKFLKAFWDHPTNRMQIRTTDLCDELTRSGNLFLMISTDQAGMSYLRAIPAAQVKEIHTKPNDFETPISFEIIKNDQLETETIQAYDSTADAPTDHKFPTVIVHYAINRPTGAVWGEPDLAPLLKWISRYSNWLDDRARLNHFRNSFLWVVHGKYSSEADRKARQTALNAVPPTPGSILVADESEMWEVLNAKLESSDANVDGLALKKMISAGSALPMYFLAEPESSTKSTAEAAGGPTYRFFEQRQRFFLWMIEDILKVVVARRKMFDRSVDLKAEIEVNPPDISGRDNVSYAMAAADISGVLKDLRDRKLIDDEEYLRLLYEFINEPLDVQTILARGKAAPDPVLKGESAPIKPTTDPTNQPTGSIQHDPKHAGKADPIIKQHIKIDPNTGEPRSDESNLD